MSILSEKSLSRGNVRKFFNCARVAILYEVYIVVATEAVETDYQEIRDSCLDMDESQEESSWSEGNEETSFSSADAIQYYMIPVNEYENSEWKVYENYLQSNGYEEAVYSPEIQSESLNGSQDSYELAENVITYDILSRSPVEVTFFIDP